MTDVLPRHIVARERTEIRAALARFGVVQAGIFGSVARGEDTAGSDLDLIVHFAPDSARDLIGLTDELTDLIGLKVDVVDDESVLARAARTGIGASILDETIPL